MASYTETELDEMIKKGEVKLAYYPNGEDDQDVEIVEKYHSIKNNSGDVPF